MSQTPTTPYQRLQAAAAQARVPDAVRAALAAAPSDPRRGQLWRVMWERTVELVVILAVNDTQLDAAPVSLETHFGDESTLLLPAKASALEQPLAVWLGLRTTLPWWVLDRPLARLPDLPSPGAPGRSEGARWGAPLPSPAVPAAEFRSAMIDTFRGLAATRWAPQGAGTLAQLFANRKVTPKQLAERLDTAPQRALAIWRGQAAVTEEEASRLAGFLGSPPGDILAANPSLPALLVHELSRPLRRWQIRELALQERSDEERVRRSAAYDNFALAARQDGGGQPDWPARVDRYFQARLGEDKAR